MTDANKPAFTKGPWVLRSDPYEDGTPYFHITAGDGYFGSEDGVRGFGLTGILSEPDARLIAAAPDLFAALRDLMERHADYINALPGEQGVADLAAARLALSRAAQGEK